MKASKFENVQLAVEYLLADQGLPIKGAGDYDLPEHFDNEQSCDKIDWARVEKTLGKIKANSKKYEGFSTLETFCCGDQDDMIAIAQYYNEDGDYAYRAIDSLFMMIGG